MYLHDVRCKWENEISEPQLSRKYEERERERESRECINMCSIVRRVALVDASAKHLRTANITVMRRHMYV
jgi:hypothetical protein